MAHYIQRFVETKYLGPTNHRPARVKAWNVTSRESVTVSWHDSTGVEDAHEKAALMLFEAGAVLVGCSTEKGFIFTTKG